MSHASTQAYDRIGGCASIHLVSGETLWASLKSVGIYCRTPEELLKNGFKKLIEGGNDFNFSRSLQQCAELNAELSHNIRIQTDNINSAIELRLVPLDRCENSNCQQLVMVISRAEDHGASSNHMNASKRALDIKVSPKLLDLKEFARSSFDRFSEQHNQDISLEIQGDEADFPLVNSDPVLLGLLLQQLLQPEIDVGTPTQKFRVSIARRARSVSMMFSSTCSPTPELRETDQKYYVSSEEKAATGEENNSQVVARLLGAKLRATGLCMANAYAELILPINAQMVMPAPETLAAEIVHIPRAANFNSLSNPIPRKLRTG
ncbi:MAG: hypothetical protein AAF478_05120 [Pseudomonadota bacterium]